MVISFRENVHTQTRTLTNTGVHLQTIGHAHGRHMSTTPHASDYCRSDPAINDKIYVKRDERKRHLMVSMIDGCFKWRGPGPPLLFLLTSFATYSTTSILAPSCGLRPAVYLTVHLREGLTKVKPVRGVGTVDGEVGGLLAGRLHCAVAGRPLRDSARLRCGETRQGLPSGLMPCNED